MEKKYSEYLYLKEDIDKAFNMGLETAIVVLEKSMALSRTGQRYMLHALKKKIEEGKIFNVINSPE